MSVLCSKLHSGYSSNASHMPSWNLGVSAEKAGILDQEPRIYRICWKCPCGMMNPVLFHGQTHEPISRTTAGCLAGGLPAHRNHPFDRGHRRLSGPAFPRRAHRGPPHRSAAVLHRDGGRRAVAPTRDSATRRNECRPGQMETILTWCRAGQSAPGRKERPVSCPPPSSPDRSLPTCWPVRCALHDDRFGVLLLVARPGAAFEPQHVELMQVLLEPFAAALENDRHVAEMAALREAAEADKRSLAQTPGTRQAGRYDRRHRLRAARRHGARGVGLQVRRAGAHLRRDRLGQGGRRPGDPQRLARAQRPFIRVNCGAIPHELIDSQLFGHEKGAFTGATETRQGWFERADGGTLLLDELAELPLAAQVRLLRILQDGWLDRVGGQRPISVDVRIVAATHRDLPGMVAAGQFREDLWYRLAVFPIVIPPLRERLEDIPELARHFARRAATRFGLYPAEPTAGGYRAVDGVFLARQRAGAGHGDRSRGDPRRRQAIGDGQVAGRADAVPRRRCRRGRALARAARCRPRRSCRWTTSIRRHIEVGAGRHRRPH